MVKIGKKGVRTVWFLTVAVVLAAFVLWIASPLSSRAATEKETVDTATENIVLDADGTQANFTYITSDGSSGAALVQDDNSGSVFAGNDGSTKLSTKGGIGNGYKFRIDLDKKYKASLFSSVKIRMVVGNWIADETVTTTAYAADDAAFVTAAGSATTGYGNKEATLTCDAWALAADGYIDSVVLTVARTEGQSGQYFFDYVELVLATPKEATDAATENVLLYANGTQATLRALRASASLDNNQWGLFKGADGAQKMSNTGQMADTAKMRIELDKKYKADLFESVKIRMAVGTTDSKRVKTSAYSAEGTYAGCAAITKSNEEIVMLCDAQKLAVGGYIDAIDLVVSREAGTTGQYFFHSVELCVPAVKDAVDTTEESIRLDMDGTQAKICGTVNTGTGDDNLFSLFKGNDGSAKLMYTNGGGLGDGEEINVELDKKYKADLFESVKIRTAVGGASGQVTVTAYSAAGTEAGKITPAVDNADSILECDPEKLAVNGYISVVRLLVTRQNKTEVRQLFFDYVELVMPAPPVEKDKVDTADEDIRLDADGVAAKITYTVAADDIAKDATVAADNNPAIFAGNDGNTKMSLTKNIGNGGTIVIDLDKKYKADLFDKVRVRMVVGNWTEGETVTTTAYAIGDTQFATAAGQITTGYGNKEAMLECDAALLADEDGYIDAIVLAVTRNAGQGQYFFDYAELALPVELTETTTFEAGPYAVADVSGYEGITGANKWVASSNYPETFDPYGYVDHPALLTLDKKVFPDAPTVPAIATDGEVLQVNKVATVFKFGKIKAANFAQWQMTFFFTDWEQGSHTFYIYGSGTTSFTDGDGKPSGYAAQVTSVSPTARVRVKTDDLSLLANDKGFIEEIFVLWWGNAADTEDDTAGTWCGTQLWVNEIKFITAEDVEVPVVSDTYTQKDISEIMPIGEGKSFSAPATDEKTIVWMTDGFDGVTFNATLTYTQGYSFYLLLRGNALDTDYTKSGLYVWFTDEETLIGAQQGEGRFTLKKTGNVFDSGVKTRVTVRTIPYYLEGVESGYYMAVYVGDGQTPLIDAFVEGEKLSTGRYAALGMQSSRGGDYVLALSTDSQTPMSAQDVMRLTLETASGKEDIDRPRAGIKTGFLAVSGNKVSAMTVEGNAGKYDADTGMLSFTKNGSVTLQYTVENEFGTFTSQKLTVKYSDGSSGKKKCGCKSDIAASSVLFASVALGIAVFGVVAKRRKSANK